jgi:hypothetical protein
VVTGSGAAPSASSNLAHAGQRTRWSVAAPCVIPRSSHFQYVLECPASASRWTQSRQMRPSGPGPSRSIGFDLGALAR